MKIIKVIFSVVVFLLATAHVSAQDKKGNDKIAEVVFSVSMDCHNCEQKVKKNIPFEKGVKDLNTNLEKQLVTVKYETNKTDKAKLQKSIEKLGFTCEEVKGQAK